MKKFEPVVFNHDKSTKAKERFGSPDKADVQGVLYIAKAEVPAGHDLQVSVKFVKKED